MIMAEEEGHLLGNPRKVNRERKKKKQPRSIASFFTHHVKTRLALKTQGLKGLKGRTTKLGRSTSSLSIEKQCCFL